MLSVFIATTKFPCNKWIPTSFFQLSMVLLSIELKMVSCGNVLSLDRKHVSSEFHRFFCKRCNSHETLSKIELKYSVQLRVVLSMIEFAWARRLHVRFGCQISQLDSIVYSFSGALDIPCENVMTNFRTGCWHAVIGFRSLSIICLSKRCRWKKMKKKKNCKVHGSRTSNDVIV